jgi:hypothetical protein
MPPGVLSSVVVSPHIILISLIHFNSIDRYIQSFSNDFMNRSRSVVVVVVVVVVVFERTYMIIRCAPSLSCKEVHVLAQNSHHL